jgi:IS5 family transposase
VGTPKRWPVKLADIDAPPMRGRSDRNLTRIARIVDWKPIAEALAPIGANQSTRPHYPAMLLFRILLLQRWYGLSDPAAEFALADRRSFAEFVELPANAAPPSFSTISRFRRDLVRLGLLESLPAMVQKQIEDAGFVLREGAMVETSLVTI